MKILVTGAAGRLGRALVSRLGREPPPAGSRLVLVDKAPVAGPPGADVIVGDIASPPLLKHVAMLAPDIVFHLAAAPGGASEADPALSRRVNLEGALGLMAAAAERTCPRFVYASSIAVFGAPEPRPVDDDTPPRPASTYGAHKLMVETALADATRRGAIDGLALRLPGLLAAPMGATGLKSSFLSEIFHALAAGRPFTAPVGRDGHVWALSIGCAAEMLVAAAKADLAGTQGRTALNVPAVRAGVGQLVGVVAAALGADPGLIDYAPDAALEAQFARYPPLSSLAADALGLRHDGDLTTLVRRVLTDLGYIEEPECRS